MRKLVFAAAAVLALASCNDKAGTSAATPTDSSGAKKTEFVYAKQHPVDWEWGSDDNTAAALNSLKAYETGNIDESIKYFADTVKIEFENLDQRFPKDSLAAMFKQSRASMKTIRVIMDDWESVKSKDGKSEYVSLWYKQINEGVDGKIDSMEVMNDVKMKDGKIIVLNEKTRHYQVKK